MPDNDSNDTPASGYGTPFRALLEHCEENGLRFSVDAEKQRVSLSICVKHAMYCCSLGVTHEDSIFRIHVNLPVLAKDEKVRLSAAEFITRANFGLVLGNFEMDMSDGEIRYRISHFIPDGGLADSTIRNLISTALNTSDRYFPALMRLLFAGETAEDAVFLAELDLRADTIESPNDSASEKRETPVKKPPISAPSKKKSGPGRKKGRHTTDAQNPPVNPSEDNPPPATRGENS